MIPAFDLFYWLVEWMWWPESGHGYAFMSSVAGATGFFAIGVILYRRMNCHESGCWRLGKHHVEGTPYVTCHKHHPTLPGDRVKTGHIHAAHIKHLRTRLP